MGIPGIMITGTFTPTRHKMRTRVTPGIMAIPPARRKDRGVHRRISICIDPRRQRASRPETEMETRSEEHTSELQSRLHLVCRLLLEKKKNIELIRGSDKPVRWQIQERK